MKRMLPALLLLCAAILSGCAHKELSKQERFLAASPRSILIVPVVNNSVDITASDYMLSTITIPLAERGYYVFPVHMVKRVLEDDGLADSSLVHSAPASRLCALFGADAVMYITIERWDARYMVFNTSVTLVLRYEIRDGKTDEVIWKNREYMVYNSDGGGGGGLAGLVAKAVTAAVTRAAPNYMPMARQASANSVKSYPGRGIPPGPYAIDKK